MSRWLAYFIGVVLGVLLARALPHAQDRARFTIACGVLTSAEHEEAEGYFSVGQAATVMVRPQSVPAARLHDLKDKTVCLQAEVQ